MVAIRKLKTENFDFLRITRSCLKSMTKKQVKNMKLLGEQINSGILRLSMLTNLLEFNLKDETTKRLVLKCF